MVFITGGAGISIYPIDGDDTDALVKMQILLCSSKIMGKNQYVLCTHEMKEDVKQKLILSIVYIVLKNVGAIYTLSTSD